MCITLCIGSYIKRKSAVSITATWVLNTKHMKYAIRVAAFIQVDILQFEKERMGHLQNIFALTNILSSNWLYLWFVYSIQDLSSFHLLFCVCVCYCCLVQQDIEVTSPPDDSISCLAFSPPTLPGNFLIGGSWANDVSWIRLKWKNTFLLINTVGKFAVKIKHWCMFLIPGPLLGGAG